MNRLTHRVRPLNPLSFFSPLQRQWPNPPPPPPLLPRFRPSLSHSGPKSTPFPLTEVRATRCRSSGQRRLSLIDLSAAPGPDRAAAPAEDYYVHTDGPIPNVESEGRRSLPDELSRSVAVLTCESSAEGGVCYVYLVGTVHVSQESCKQVQAVISYLKPEVVFLELCSQRVSMLTPRNLKVPTYGRMLVTWMKKDLTPFGILYSWFLVKVASQLGVVPGNEFRVGFEEAMKYGGRVILGDRPVQSWLSFCSSLKQACPFPEAAILVDGTITDRRTWYKMPLWHKIKLMCAFFLVSSLLRPKDITKLVKQAMDDVASPTFSKGFPTISETVLHERDQYMSSGLFRIASEHSSVVAVIGKGHMSGIKKHWKRPVVREDLLEDPSERSVLKILTSFGVAAAGVAIVTGIYMGCKN